MKTRSRSGPAGSGAVCHALETEFLGRNSVSIHCDVAAGTISLNHPHVETEFLPRNSVSKDAVWLGLHAALVGALVAGVFDHYLFNMDFHHAVTIFWLVLGLAVGSTRLGVEEAERKPQITPISQI